MAYQAPAAKFSGGDLVNFRGNKLCAVMSCWNELGFNRYKLLDLDNGTEFMAWSHDLSEIALDQLDVSIVEDFDRSPAPSQDVNNQLNQAHSRFESKSEQEINTLASKNTEKSTNRQTKWAVRIFREWLAERDYSLDFEGLEPQELASRLRRFYAEVCGKDGKKYSKSALINIRAGLNRHLTSPPYCNQYNIMRDIIFQSANQVVTGVIKDMRRQGFDTTTNKAAIEVEDAKKMYSSGVLSNETPKALQNKVFFEISLHFARRGREGLRDLKKNSFVVKSDACGRKFVAQTFNEKDKNHAGVNAKEKEKSGVMYEQRGSAQCPVKSFELYLSKLHPGCEILFQRPRRNVFLSDDIWYENVAVGHNTLGNLMKCISTEAGLSKVYTNHCISATTTTVLHRAGIEAEQIKNVTGHRSTERLKHYIEGPSENQKHQNSSILSSFVSGNPCDNSMAMTSTAVAPVVNDNVRDDIEVSVSNSHKEVCREPASEREHEQQAVVTAQTGMGSLFCGATLGDNCVVTINFNAGSYKRNES